MLRWLSDFKDFYAEYDTYEEANTARDYSQIPSFVPRSARNILKSVDLDVGRIWLSFQFDAADLSAMQEELIPLEINEVRFPIAGRRKWDAWWSRDLRGASPESAEEFDFYRVEETVLTGGGEKWYDGYVAIEKDAPRAWYWNIFSVPYR
jgi:hypothetical protein